MPRPDHDLRTFACSACGHGEIVKIIALPDMKERMATLGFDPIGSAPEECAAQFRTEAAKWGKVIREAGIKAQ